EDIAFITNAPVVVGIPAHDLPFIRWGAVREVRIGAKPGKLERVFRVSVDWNNFLKTGMFREADLRNGTELIYSGQEYRLWKALLPPDTKSVYAKFVFRDGTESDEMRYPVDDVSIHD